LSTDTPTMAAAASVKGIDVHLPPRYVLRAHHVKDALERLPPGTCNVTVWIHSSTLGIEKKCFEGTQHRFPRQRGRVHLGSQRMVLERVSRILVWGPEHNQIHTVTAAVLGMFIAKLRAYEPDLVDLIRDFARHMGNNDMRSEMHRVGDSAFNWHSALREVVLPRSITHVGSAAFNMCTSLTSVTLPNSLTSVGNSAFSECTSLMSVTLPDSLTHIGDYAFFKCTSLTSVALPDSITHLGDCTFYWCTSLESVTLPTSLAHVGDYAFYKCTSLTSVTLPNSLTHLGEFAFNECTALARVTMPAVRPSVGRNAFRGCPWRK
jgi:hypothetical protein